MNPDESRDFFLKPIRLSALSFASLHDAKGCRYYPGYDFLDHNKTPVDLPFMKYARLTKEQFEELHPEFINFLATQSIDKSEWDKIKNEKPEIAEQELDIFSDLIWEGVVSRAIHLEHFSKNHIFLFHCFEKHIESIILKSLVPETDFMTQDGLQWLRDNLFSETIEIKIGKKDFTEDRNKSIFELIQQGACLSEGKLYQQIHSIIES